MLEGLSTVQFWLLITLFIVLFLTGVTAFSFSFKKKNIAKVIFGIGMIVSTLLFIALIIYSLVDTNYPYFTNLTKLDNIGLYLCTLAVILIICLLCIFIGKKKEVSQTKEIAYAAICIACSFALSYVKLFSLPFGGSVTLASLLPLMIFSYMFGIRKGCLIGFIYGLLQFVQSPWFYHPVQFLCDYPIAFAGIGLAGLFYEIKGNVNNKDTKFKFPIKFILGAIIALIIRYLSHVISGIFVFGSGDPENYSAVAWSFLYNSFVLVDGLFDIVIGAILLSSRQVNSILIKSTK